jgi:GTP cyclohydrolase IA
VNTIPNDYTGYASRPSYNYLECRERHLEFATPEELIDAFLQKVCPDLYDPEDDHFRDTPRRFTRMMQELTDGSENFTFTTFPAASQEMVVIKRIRFVSVCAHHLAPFTGVCHVGYIPDEKMAGISKFARHVKAYAHTLTNQEQLTANIADSLLDILEPLGVMVVMRATHSCMSVRGALAHDTETITSATRGRFSQHDKTAKAEFLQFINGAG